MFSVNLILMVTCFLVRQALASCPCGYTIVDTAARYTNMILTNFSLFPDTPNLTKNQDFTSDWKVASNTIAAAASGTLARQYNRENVFVRSGALHLRQVAYTIDSSTTGDPVSCASIFSAKSDFLYGSFRVLSRVSVDQTATNKGSVAGWFFYAVSRKPA